MEAAAALIAVSLFLGALILLLLAALGRGSPPGTGEPAGKRGRGGGGTRQPGKAGSSRARGGLVEAAQPSQAGSVQPSGPPARPAGARRCRGSQRHRATPEEPGQPR